MRKLWIFENIYIDYLLAFLIVASSGIMFFYRNDEYIILGMLISGAYFIYKRKKVGMTFIFLFVLFTCIEFLQMGYFNNYNFKSLVGSLGKIVLAYMVIKLLNKKFITYFINIIYFFALVSFVFYGLTYIPSITNFIVYKICPYFKPLFPIPFSSAYPYTPNIILYNYNPDHVLMMRNSGPFWESGAFAIYLIMAGMLNTFKEGKILNKKNIVFLIACITTYSTACYLALFFYVGGYIIFSSRVKYKLLYITLAGTISIWAFFSLDFMEEKIKGNMELAGETTTSRFGSAAADFKLLSKSTFIGYGKSNRNRYGTDTFNHDEMHRNNGLTYLLTTYGVFVFFIYFYFDYVGMRRLNYIYDKNNKYAIVCLGTLVLLSFSQKILMLPFFFCMLFLKILEEEDEDEAENNTPVINSIPASN
jgi:hypothetical protein